MESVTLGIGILFVIVYSYERFNNPISNRSSTTAIRYHLAAISYCMVYLTIFYLLNKYPELIKIVLDRVEAKTDIYEQYNKLPSALLVALLLTGFLQKIPFLSHVDLRLRKHIQFLAAIPYEVRRLAKELRSVGFLIDMEVQGAVYKRLRDDGLTCDDINLDEQNESYHLWSKVSVLMYHFSQWEADRKTSGYMASRADEYRILKNRYYRLSEMAKTYMTICCQKERKAVEDPAILELIKTFQESCRSLLTAQCEFISHGALKSILTRQPRISFLRNMGFQLPPDEGGNTGITINHMATLLIGLFSGLLIVMSLYGNIFEDGSQDVTRMLYLITLISAMNMVAVATVIYTKGKWPFTERDEKGTRPTFYYILVALAAVIISTPITLLFKTIVGMGTPVMDVTLGAPAPADLGMAFKAGWDGFITKSFPWKLMVFTTTLCLAYQLDTHQMGKIKYPTMRWIEGLIQALVALAAAYATYYWLVDVNPVWKDIITLEETVIRSTIIGFIIGCTIPYWYKVVPKKYEDDTQTDEDFILGKSLESAAQTA